MGKILIIVSVVISLLTAALGYVNHTKLVETKTDLANTKTTLETSNKNLAASQKDLKTTKDSLASVTTEKEQVTTQLTSAQSDLAAAKTDLSNAQAQVTTLKTDSEKLTADLAAANQKIAELTNPTPNPNGGQPNSALAELQTQIEEQKTVISKLTADLNNAQAKIAELTKDADDRRKLALRPGVEGRILAVNPAWNFVVLSLGDKQGVASNTELLVKRGNQLVGKIRVTSVEPSSSIADIVANSVPNGTAISPGDHVIYKSAE